MKKLQNKRVVVTGAGYGFGRALALEFARLGCKVGVVDINDARSKETVRMVQQAGGEGVTFHADVTDPAAIKEMADHFFSTWRGVDILVNNAGIAVAGHVGDVPLKDWESVVDINTWGMVYGCHEFIPRMKAQGGGHILNVASAAGLLSITSMGPYNVSKAAIVSLSETLRVEVAPYNIDITVACPVFFNTGLLDEMKSTDPWISKVARIGFEVGLSADTVAKRVVNAVAKNKFYVVPMFYAKLLWLSKRLMPNLYYNLAAGFNKRGWLEPLYLKIAQWGVLSK